MKTFITSLIIILIFHLHKNQMMLIMFFRYIVINFKKKYKKRKYRILATNPK